MYVPVTTLNGKMSYYLQHENLKDCDDPDKVFYEKYSEFQGIVDDINKPEIDTDKKRKKKKYSSQETSLNTYYKNLNKINLFSEKEEILYLKKYAEIKNKISQLEQNESDEKTKLKFELTKIRNLIVEKNLRFVIKIARGFWIDGNPQTLENLISAGNLGLIESVDKFKIDKNVKFLTYAMYWIVLGIRDEIDSDSLVKIPTWWRKTVRRIQKAYSSLEQGNEDIDIETLAKAADVSKRHVEKFTGLKHTVNKTGISSMPKNFELDEAMIPCPSDLADTDLQKKQESQLLLKEIKKLPRQQRVIISAAFGIGSTYEYNHRQISNILGNTGERVRQLKTQSLETLKQKLEPFIDS